MLASVLSIPLLHDFYVVLAGPAAGRWTLLGVAAALLLAPWILMPPGLYWLPPPQGPPAMEPFDPQRHPLPDAEAEWMRQTVAALRAEGFAQVDDVVARPSPRQAVRVIMLDHAAEGIRAMIQGGAGARVLQKDFLSFATVLGDGRWVAVSNEAVRSGFPQDPDAVAAFLPDVRGTAELLAAFRALVAETAGPRARSVPPGSDIPGFASLNYRRNSDHLLAHGWYRRAGGRNRLSFRAAVLTAWTLYFPLRQIRMRRTREAQDEVLRRLRLPLPSRKPVSLWWWLSSGGLRMAGAAVLLALGVAWPWL